MWPEGVPIIGSVQKSKGLLAWCGILVLCIAVGFQLLGVAGTLLNIFDSEDDYQASVMTGYTIPTAAAALLGGPISVTAVFKTPLASAFLGSEMPFHPPLFI